MYPVFESVTGITAQVMPSPPAAGTGCIISNPEGEQAPQSELGRAPELVPYVTQGRMPVAAMRQMAAPGLQ